MRTTLTFALLLASIPATLTHAAPIEPAPGCNSDCSAPMHAIVADFTQAETIDTRALPVLFSGDCFHLNRQYDPNHTHYGFTLLENKENEFYMGGIFAFHTKENPYLAMTIEEARKETPRRFDDHHRLTVSSEHAFADMNRENPKFPWKFWLKQKNDSLLLQAQWGPYHRVYCRFLQNR